MIEQFPDVSMKIRAKAKRDYRKAAIKGISRAGSNEVFTKVELRTWHLNVLAIVTILGTAYVIAENSHLIN